MRFSLAILTACGLGLAAVTSGFAQEAAGVPTRVDETGHEVYHANDVIGMVVHDPDERRVGRVEDLVIDARTDEVLYAVMSFEGVRAIGDRWVVLPVTYFDPRQEFVMLNVPMNTIVRAPMFTAAQFRQMRFTQWGPRVDRFFADVRIGDTRIAPRGADIRAREQDPDVAPLEQDRIEQRDIPLREEAAPPRTPDRDVPPASPRIDRRPAAPERAPAPTAPGVRQPTAPSPAPTAPSPVPTAPSPAPTAPSPAPTAPSPAPTAPQPPADSGAPGPADN